MPPTRFPVEFLTRLGESKPMPSAKLPDMRLLGQAAKVLGRPDHQVRRTVDKLWPNGPRSGRFRLIERSKLCELAAAIEERYGSRLVSS